MTKKLKLTETDLVDIINKIVKEDEELGGMTSDPRVMKKEYGDRTSNGDLSKEEIIKNLWQIQGLLKECSPAIALSRIVILLEELGESINYLRDREYPCDADGLADISESKQSINEQDNRITQSRMEGYMETKFKDLHSLIVKYNQTPDVIYQIKTGVESLLKNSR